MIYATLDNNNICIGVCQLSGEVKAAELIQIAEYDLLLIGQFWNGSEFTPLINPEPSPEALVLFPIVIENVTGDEVGFDNGPNEYTCLLGATVTFTGPLAIPDRKFRVPCAMTDTGRTIFGVADVVAGVMTITVTFPELGKWQLTESMVNEGLPQPAFSLSNPITCVVI